jgi:steroid 5-alpha reductase family enzyme
MESYLITAGCLLIYMTGWFLAAQIRGRNDIADVAWGMGFVLVSAVSIVAGGSYPARGLLVSSLVLAWGFRLALHIHSRNSGKAEDPRYKKWREEWGRWFVLRSFLQIFMLQGILVLLVALPILYINTAPAVEFGWLDMLGCIIWLLGFSFEATADRQLTRFIRDPRNRGHIMTGGLWRYSRHPNYFGEVTLWWGLWLIACSLPGGWLTLVGPLTITILILKVSGIPMLEEHYQGRADFEEYKHRTSAFFPLPRRRGE